MREQKRREDVVCLKDIILTEIKKASYGMTTYKLAKLSDLAPNQVSLILEGRNTTIETYQKLFNALNIKQFNNGK